MELKLHLLLIRFTSDEPRASGCHGATGVDFPSEVQASLFPMAVILLLDSSILWWDPSLHRSMEPKVTLPGPIVIVAGNCVFSRLSCAIFSNSGNLCLKPQASPDSVLWRLRGNNAWSLQAFPWIAGQPISTDTLQKQLLHSLFIFSSILSSIFWAHNSTSEPYLSPRIQS